MYGFLLAILVLDGLFLGVVILLQSGKGGGLAAMGGGVTATEGILAGRQATTVLTRATWIAGGIFMGLALVLSILSSRAQQPQSILLEEMQQTAPAPEPILPGLTDPSTGEPGTSGGSGEVPPPSDPPGGDPGGS
ncbi:MAG: preprotein translocase subunit SecG [Longimicrobiales bacterium]